MKKTRHKSLQRQIDSLIPIVELILPAIEEFDSTRKEFSFLSDKLDCLKQQRKYLQTEPSFVKCDADLELQIDKAEFEVDSLVDDLEKILRHFNTVNIQLNNLLVLKERLEAVQEELVEDLTPERIYKLLRKQRIKNSNRSSDLKLKLNYVRHLWQNTIKDKLANKAVSSIAIASTVLLSIGAVYYYSVKAQDAKNNSLQKNVELNQTVTELPNI